MKEINTIIGILGKSLKVIGVSSTVDNITIVKSEGIIKTYIGDEMVSEIRSKFSDKDMIKILEKIGKVIFNKTEVETKVYIGKTPVISFK